MPLISTSTYRSPWWLTNPHWQTIFPTVFRPEPPIHFSRERVSTPDGDFLDLDWVKNGHSRLLIALHGLEGSSESKYIKGIVRAFSLEGWDGLALNFRGCSGEPNLLTRAYHSGETGDLDFVLHYALQKGYTRIVVAGFSLGGNVLLKYLGEQGNHLHPKITHGITFSVPCDLAASSSKLDQWDNYIYRRRFMVRLRKKVRVKPDLLKMVSQPENLKNFQQFDNAITAPIHGFQDAADYYHRSSSKAFLAGIRIPTLLVNARNDPFLTESCFPKDEAEASDCLYLETPQDGGHVGFHSVGNGNIYWSEQRAIRFVEGV